EPWDHEWRFRFELAMRHVVVRQRTIEGILSRNESDRNVAASRGSFRIIEAAVIRLPIQIPGTAKVRDWIIASGLFADPEDRRHNVCFPGITLHRWPGTCRHEYLRLHFEQRLLAQLHRVLGKIRSRRVWRARLFFCTRRTDRASADQKSKNSSHRQRLPFFYLISPPRARHFIMEKPVPVAVTNCKALSVPIISG